MAEWKDHYRVGDPVQMKPWSPDMDMEKVSISQVDRLNDSPNEGDMIARNPNNKDDQWLVSKAFYREFYRPLDEE